MKSHDMTAAPNQAARHLGRWALVTALPTIMLCGAGQAMAQADPTLDQVYQAARAGHVDQAQQMMAPVLRDHPASGKAHYVEAELLARQGQLAKAREELDIAERLAPGLPFARAPSVQALQQQIEGPTALPRSPAAPHTGSFSPVGSIPWGVLFAILGGGWVAWLLTRIGRSPVAPASRGTTAYVPTATVPAWSPAPAGTMAPAPSTGLGQQVAGGLATGLAAGAGLMAAEALGRRLFSGDRPASGASGSRALTSLDPSGDTLAANAELGGRDFGVDAADSWDDPGATSGDWDT